MSRSEAICQTRLADEYKSVSRALHGGKSRRNKLENPCICMSDEKKKKTELLRRSESSNERKRAIFLFFLLDIRPLRFFKRPLNYG